MPKKKQAHMFLERASDNKIQIDQTQIIEGSSSGGRWVGISLTIFDPLSSSTATATATAVSAPSSPFSLPLRILRRHRFGDPSATASLILISDVASVVVVLVHSHDCQLGFSNHDFCGRGWNKKRDCGVGDLVSNGELLKNLKVNSGSNLNKFNINSEAR